jgi:hypothetical protein
MDPFGLPAPPLVEPPVEPAARGRRPFGCLTAIGLFLVGFVGVALVLFRPAPTISSSPLGDAIVPPAGYLRLDDSESGGGRLDASRAAELLNRTSLPSFRDGLLRAWGRAPGEPSRAVVILVLDLGSPADAEAAQAAYATARRSLGATPFGTPEGLRANGFADIPDDAGRYAQRVAFTSGTRLLVVSVVTPAAETDHAEVVRLAVRQSAGQPAPEAGAVFLERDARSIDPTLRAVPPGGVLAVVLLLRAATRPAPGRCTYVYALTFATDPPVSATMGGWIAAVSAAVGDIPTEC